MRSTRESMPCRQSAGKASCTLASALPSRISSARQKLKWPAGSWIAFLAAMMSCFTGGLLSASSCAGGVLSVSGSSAGSPEGMAASCEAIDPSSRCCFPQELLLCTYSRGFPKPLSQTPRCSQVPRDAPAAARAREPAARHADTRSQRCGALHAAPSPPPRISPHHALPSPCCPDCTLREASTAAVAMGQLLSSRTRNPSCVNAWQAQQPWRLTVPALLGQDVEAAVPSHAVCLSLH